MDRYIIPPEEALRLMEQARTCPPLDMLMRGGADIDKHIATCPSCRNLVQEEKEDFQISDEELNEACEKRLQNVPESEKDSYKEMIKEEMQFGKVLPFLLEKNTFKTGDKKSYSEYMGR